MVNSKKNTASGTAPEEEAGKKKQDEQIIQELLYTAQEIHKLNISSRAFIDFTKKELQIIGYYFTKWELKEIEKCLFYNYSYILTPDEQPGKIRMLIFYKEEGEVRYL